MCESVWGVWVGVCRGCVCVCGVCMGGVGVWGGCLRCVVCVGSVSYVWGVGCRVCVGCVLCDCVGSECYVIVWVWGVWSGV